jgi:hypothetical protein
METFLHGLWIAPGKRRTNPEKDAIDPEKDAIAGRKAPPDKAFSAL